LTGRKVADIHLGTGRDDCIRSDLKFQHLTQRWQLGLVGVESTNEATKRDVCDGQHNEIS
jgi:hypothetical protein